MDRIPDLPPALLLLGKSYARQARWAEARPLLERAERLAPHDAAVHFEMARLYQNIGRDQAARRESELHRQALRYDAEKQRLIDRIRQKRDDGAYLPLARLQAAHGETEQAISLYRMIVASHAARANAPEREQIERELARLERTAGSGPSDSIESKGPTP
jgi:tetratricopeptide (TPR) repeat protein